MRQREGDTQPRLFVNTDSPGAVKYLRQRLPGVHYANLVSAVRTPLARSLIGAGILLRQHSIEVFPVNLDLRHYESAASWGTA